MSIYFFYMKSRWEKNITISHLLAQERITLVIYHSSQISQHFTETILILLIANFIRFYCCKIRQQLTFYTLKTQHNKADEQHLFNGMLKTMRQEVGTTLWIGNWINDIFLFTLPKINCFDKTRRSDQALQFKKLYEALLYSRKCHGQQGAEMIWSGEESISKCPGTRHHHQAAQ